MRKILFLTVVLASCNIGVTHNESRMYKVLDKIENKNGYCTIYWFDEYKMRRNEIKCDSCYIGQRIGEDGLKI